MHTQVHPVKKLVQSRGERDRLQPSNERSSIVGRRWGSVAGRGETGALNGKAASADFTLIPETGLCEMTWETRVAHKHWAGAEQSCAARAFRALTPLSRASESLLESYRHCWGDLESNRRRSSGSAGVQWDQVKAALQIYNLNKTNGTIMEHTGVFTPVVGVQSPELRLFIQSTL